MNRFTLFVLATAAVLIPLPAAANGESERIIQYSVEFVCGSNDADYETVVPGDYTMVVNVHNASSEPTEARSKVSLTFPAPDMSSPLMTHFAPQQSRQLNCGDILNLFPSIQPIGSAPLLQGFLLIQSRHPLEVVARYTATGDSGEVSVDVERVPGREIDRPVEEPEEEQVEICHVPPGNPSNAHEIEVGASAVASHIAHGDYVGECDDVSIPPVPVVESASADEDESDDDPKAKRRSNNRKPR